MAENISNEYNMIKILQDVGSSFFSTELSEQRIGMFGFTCEAMARLFGATILDSNMRSNEYHTITAKKMDTLLHDASILGVNIENTNPSEIVAYIAFDNKLIHRTEFCNPDNPSNYSIDKKTYYFIIERDTTINIAGYNFMLEWDILVTAKYNGTEYVYSARYLSEGDEDPHSNEMCKGGRYIKEDTLSTLTDKYIQGNVVTSGSDSLFMMRVNLRQMSKKYEYHTVTENDMISLTGLEFQYDDYFSHFNVYYRAKQTDPWEYIRPVSIYDTSEYTDKTIRYQIDSDSNLLIINATEFDMPYNAELRLDIYTTKGSTGNITYSGDGSDIVCELLSYENKHIYNGIDLACVPITAARYGKDAASIEDARGKVIRAKASRNALSTEYDLFNFMKERDLINDYFFIKKRSDILEHIYGTYTILRTETNDTIPTTTLNLIIKKEPSIHNGIYYTPNDESSFLTIKAGTPFKLVNKDDSICTIAENIGLDDTDKKFLATVYDRVDEDGNILTNEEVAAKENEMKLFALPYTLAYDTKNQLSALYLTSVNRSVNMSATEVNDSLEESSNFVIDHINISRNSYIGENYYDVEVTVMPNGDYNNCIIDGDINTGLSENALMLKGFIYGTDTSDMTSNVGTDYPYAFFDFNFVSFVNNVFTFRASIKIDDSVNVSGNLIKTISSNFMYILSDLQRYNSDSSTDVSDLEMKSQLSNIVPNEICPIDLFNLKIGIAAYYLSSTVGQTEVPSIKFNGEDEEGDPVPETNIYGYPEFTNGGTDYIMTNLYTNSSDLIDLYTDMSYVTRITTDENIQIVDNDGNVTDAVDNDHVFFRDVPLLQYSKAINEDISNRVTNIVSDTKVYLDEINMRLDDSFSLDYKFFRTYGPSQYFQLESTNGKNKEILDSLDISLTLNARLKSGITTADSDIIYQIKTFLKEYIEKLNDEDDDYTIYMSNITTELEKKFSDILKSIDLVDINGKGDDYRVILYNKPQVESYYSQLNGNTTNRDTLKKYIPEYINLPIENITINIIR